MLYSVMFCHGPNKPMEGIPPNVEYYVEDQEQTELLRCMAQFPVGSVFEVSTAKE